MSSYTIDLWRSRLSVLTKREQDIAYHLLQGMSTPEIAQELGCNLNTCKLQVHNILKKLNYVSRDRMIADFVDQDILEVVFDGLTQVKLDKPMTGEIEEIHL